MARNRTPAQILQLKGAYKKDPQRNRGPEPKAGTFKKTPPRHFNPEEKKVWRELIRDIADGVLQQSDRIILEQACLLLCVIRKSRSTLIPIYGSNGKLINMRMACPVSAHQALTSCLSRLGMTPADRTRVSIPEAKVSKFDRAAARA